MNRDRTECPDCLGTRCSKWAPHDEFEPCDTCNGQGFIEAQAGPVPIRTEPNYLGEAFKMANGTLQPDGLKIEHLAAVIAYGRAMITQANVGNFKREAANFEEALEKIADIEYSGKRSYIQLFGLAKATARTALLFAQVKREEVA